VTGAESCQCGAVQITLATAPSERLQYNGRLNTRTGWAGIFAARTATIIMAGPSIVITP